MADKPQYAIVARPKNYWMSARAVSITLNALNEANRIQASTAASAQIFVYFDEYQKIGDRETFGYDAGHNFNSWPLTVYPTYFGTYEAVHVHAAIPRTEAVGQQAMFVYPTAILDVEGYEVEAVPMQDDEGNYIDEKGNIVDDPDDAATAYVRKKKTDGSEQDADPVGSQNYYYIYLHGMLTGSGTAGTTFREWTPMYDTGRLNTDETWGETVTLEQLAREMKKKVDVEWFQRIFKIHGTDRQRVPTDWDDDGKAIEWETDDDGNFIYEGDDERRDIKPNDMDHEITDTESMFGTWTQHWLSALGIGSGSGGSGGGGGGGDALDEPLLSINQMVAKPTTAGQTLVWKGIGLGINGSGWDFDTAGMSQQDIQALFDSRYLKLTSQSPQSVTSDITLNGLLTIDHGQGFDPTQVDSNVVLTKGETLTLLDGRYVTVAFWNSLFETYNNKTKVNVNTANPVIDNLKILVGTWTEQYLSALGIGSGGGGGGGAALDEPLLSINAIGSNPSEANQTLVFDGSHWTYGSAGLDTEALGQYLGTNKYLTESGMTGYEWWGQKFSANSKVISGDMTGVGNITAANSTKVITGFRLKASLFLSSHNAGGTSGSTGWVNVAKITVVSAWASQPLKFRVTQRGRMGAELTVRFLDANSAAGTTISEFYYTGDIAGARIVQSGTEFYLYIQKTGAYDSIGISLVDLGSYANGTFTIEWRDVHSSTAPGATVATCRYYFASNVYMEYDSTNSGVHLVGAGLYADTYLSALGTGSGGSAGGGMDLEAMWTALGGTYRTNEQISASHLTNVTKALTITVNGTAKTYDGTSAQSVSINTTSTIEGATDVSSYFTNDKKALDADKLDGKDLSELFETLKNSTASGHDNDIEVKVGGVTKYLTVGYATSSGTAAACSGNASTATKLAASVKLWGNDFDGSTGIGYNNSHRANLAYVGSISMNSSISGCTNIDDIAYFKSSKLGINTGSTDPAYTLDVSGNIRATQVSWFPSIELSDSTPYIDFHNSKSTADYTTRIIESASGVLTIQKYSGATGLVIGGNSSATQADYIKIGGATLTWDNTNQALHIDKGVYSDTYVSALGIGSGGSGGGGMTEDQMWVALGTNGQAKQVALTHLTLALQNYAKTSDVTKNLTIKQDGQEDVVYNGTAAKTITITGATTDTKDTTGAYQKQSTKLYLVGTESFNQKYAVTNINGSCYIDTNNILNAPKFQTAANSGFYHRLDTDSQGYGGLSVHGGSSNVNDFFVYISPTLQITLGNSLFGKGVRVYGSNTIFYSVNNGTTTECLRTTKSGNVAISNGLSSDPGYKLYVDGTSCFTNDIKTNNNMLVNGMVTIGGYSTDSGDNNGKISLDSEENLLITTGNYIKLLKQTVASSKLTIGQTTPNNSYNLYVNGTSYFTNTSLFLGNICIGAAGSSSLQLDMRKNKIVLGNIFLRSVGDTVYFDATDADEGYVRGYGGCTIVSGSDMRQKNVVETAECDLESVARAPIFNFTWKNTKKNVLHLGSSAQYWKNIFPCATPLLDDGYYSMDYGATALAAAVMTARTVLTHDEEIARLKRRIGELEQEIETLKLSQNKIGSTLILSADNPPENRIE